MAIEQDVEAVVIHRRAYRETSMLVDFFSPQKGRFCAVAKGLRNPKSARKGLLQPFQTLTIGLSGKGNLKNLTQVEASGLNVALTGKNLYCGFYMNELLMRVLPEAMASETLYSLYLLCLKQLEQNIDADVVLRQFEFALLEELGVMPDLSCCSDTDTPVEPDNYYYFNVNEGILLTHQDSPDGISGQALMDIASGNWNDASRRAAKRLCRFALAPFLGNKPLHSRRLFKQ